jgi:hypothetical protein
MRNKIVIIGVILTVFSGIAWYAVTHTDEHYRITNASLVDDKESANLPIVKQYRARIASVREQTPPILNVDTPTAEQEQAFHILAESPRLNDVIKAKDGSVYRLEIMQSYQLPTGQAVDQFAECASQRCYRMDLFNFTLNTSVVAVANLDSKNVITVQVSQSQPEISRTLTTIAGQIATNNPEVKKTFGDKGTPIMSATKTALERTVCEKSRHLCVAPTFVMTDKKTALWVIVDLTDLKVVGTAWTKWDDKPVPVTERQLRTQVIEDTLCGKVVTEKRGDWNFSYTLTSSDGLEIRDVSYQDKPVIASAKNVDWHVSYSSKDGFGYSDAVGCPVFSTAAVVPSKLPEVRAGPDGQVLLNIDFEGEKWPEPCNYYYRQQFQMNPDGSIRVAVANVGRGCGDDGTYRPVTRIVLPEGASDFRQGGTTIEHERWWRPDSCDPGTSCPTLSYAAGNTAYDVIPGNGQFNDDGKGDGPFLYLSVVKPERLEGQEDLLTIGPCCNVDYQQGPEKFVDNESLKGQKAALWYVAQLKNNGNFGEEYCWAKSRISEGSYDVSEYPCYSGPLLKPRGR